MTQNRRDPFDERSPFEALERARRMRLLVAVCNFTTIGLAPVIISFLLVVIISFQWQTLVVVIITAGILPFTIIVRRAAQVDNPNAENLAFLMFIYFLIIIGSNGLLIDGLFGAVAPSYAVSAIMGGMVLKPRFAYFTGFAGAGLWAIGLVIDNSESFQGANVSEEIVTLVVAVIVIAVLLIIAYLSQIGTQDLRRALTDATYDLKLANENLQDASELKSMFMANTSHELRTPLSSIMVFTDLTLREAYGPVTDQQEENLGRVLHNAKRLNLLINDLLDLSKIEAGELTIIEEEFELNNLIKTLRSTVQTQAEEKQLEFSIQQQDILPKYIVGDEQRLSQIMINLTHNAIKFTERGEVEVNIGSPTKDKWVFSVRDTGRGIHQKDLDMIFEAFRQAGKPSDEVTMHGTGLGLAITQHLVDLMNGNIKVQSQYGKGSTFTVTLPLKTVPVFPSPSQVS